MQIKLAVPACLKDDDQMIEALQNSRGSAASQLVLGGLIDVIHRSIDVPSQAGFLKSYPKITKHGTQAGEKIQIDAAVDADLVASEHEHFLDMAGHGTEWIWCGDDDNMTEAACTFQALCDILHRKIPVDKQQAFLDGLLSDAS